MENSNFCVGSCLYIILHMASRHQCQCFAFSLDREKLSYKSISHVPVCPRLAAKVWLVWSWPYQYLCILLDLAVTLPQQLSEELQLPNVMFLYIILHMAIKLSRHQCQHFAFSYHRQREIIIYKYIPYPCMSKAGSKCMAGMVMAISILCILLDLAVTLPRGLQYPCTQ